MLEYRSVESFAPADLEGVLNDLAKDGWRLHTVQAVVVPSADGLTVGQRWVALCERLATED